MVIIYPKHTRAGVSCTLSPGPSVFVFPRYLSTLFISNNNKRFVRANLRSLSSKGRLYVEGVGKLRRMCTGNSMDVTRSQSISSLVCFWIFRMDCDGIWLACHTDQAKGLVPEKLDHRCPRGGLNRFGKWIVTEMVTFKNLFLFFQEKGICSQCQRYLVWPWVWGDWWSQDRDDVYVPEVIIIISIV